VNVSEALWKSRLSVLAGQLARYGDLRSAPWRTAFTETPRHVFVPTVISITESDSTTVSGADPAQHQSWLDQVCSDDSLVTHCTMPSLMARMLEALDVHDGHRVLEIGTGTGYNAVLLCHRLGSSNVVSIDIDPAFVAAARHRLTDGTAGAAQHGLYDRIIATAAVPMIPLLWIDQLAPGGKIVANLRGEVAGGTLCLLTKEDDDEVIGAVLPIGGHFMWLRPQAGSPLRVPEPPRTRGSRNAARTSTALDPSMLVNNDSFRFLLPLHLHGAASFSHTRVHDPRTRTTRDGVLIDACDLSYAEVITSLEPGEQHPVIQAGPRRLWAASRPPISCGATSAVPIPAALGLSPTPPPSSSGSTPTKAGTDGPFR
jgi:protein-L-isoaspartate O-methyltransferase